MTGLHLSSAKPLSSVIHTAQSYGCKTFQLFVRNNRNMRQRFISDEEIDDFNMKLFSSGLLTYCIHAPYSMNPSSPDAGKRQRAINIIQEDMDLLYGFGGRINYVLHPGSHMDYGFESGLQGLLEVLSPIRVPRNVKICLEYMSGAGTEMLSSVDEIKACYSAFATRGIPMSFTFDTCHVFASGRNPVTAYEEIKDYVQAVHVNGSYGEFNSHVDRHSNLLDGNLAPMVNVLLCSRVPEKIPIILETPAAGAYADLIYLNKQISSLKF